MEDEVKKAISDFIKKEEQNENLELDGADLVKSGIVDSFFMMKLTDFLERTFGARLSADDLTEENFRSLEKLARLISK